MRSMRGGAGAVWWRGGGGGAHDKREVHLDARVEAVWHQHVVGRLASGGRQQHHFLGQSTAELGLHALDDVALGERQLAAPLVRCRVAAQHVQADGRRRGRPRACRLRHRECDDDARGLGHTEQPLRVMPPRDRVGRAAGGEVDPARLGRHAHPHIIGRTAEVKGIEPSRDVLEGLPDRGPKA